MSVEKIRKAVEAADGNARQIGEVVLMIAEADRHAAEVIAADLDNPIIKVICDFYKIPAEAFGTEAQTLGHEKQQADELDLMSLL